RGEHTAAVQGSRVLFAGGRDPSGSVLATGELAELTSSGARCLAGDPSIRPMISPHVAHAAVAIPAPHAIAFLRGHLHRRGEYRTSSDAAEMFVWRVADQ